MTRACSLRDLPDELETLAPRTPVGTRPCHRCGATADVFEGDPRAQGWLRLECPSCRAWGDVEPR